MPIPRIETRDAMGDPDVVYLNPDHVLWMSQPTAAQRRTAARPFAWTTA